MSAAGHLIDEQLAFVGDGRWWERHDCFRHPQARQFVPELESVISELRTLFPAEVCIELMRRGHGARVIGLFLGDSWCDAMDEMLQLGSDLLHCAGWDGDGKLV